MKTIDGVVAVLGNYLNAGWHLDAADPGNDRWPKVVALGVVSSVEADARYAEVTGWARAWHEWASKQGVELRTVTRRIRGVDQSGFPTHVVIHSADAATRAVGDGWPARIARAKSRAQRISDSFPGADVASALRLAGALGDTDFELALTAARWFADNLDIWPGLTPRQVPIAGMHGKWLNNHRPLLRTLAGLDDLTLAERGTRIHWTYLDPGHLAAGGRRHDSLTIGDTVPLPYEPIVVLIAENKDTVLLFPNVAGGIAVEGNGNTAVGLLPLVPWIAGSPTVIYWGDIDARGYEIVSGLRERLPQVRTMLMDAPTLDRFEPFGTSTDAQGNPLTARKRQALPCLTDTERAVYNAITDPGWTRCRRFEQERIPLPLAHASLLDMIGTHDGRPK